MLFFSKKNMQKPSLKASRNFVPEPYPQNMQLQRKQVLRN